MVLKKPIFWLIVGGVFFLQCATSSRNYTLSNAEPKLAQFENTPWDPFPENPHPVPNTGLSYIDDFLERGNQILAIFKTGEKVIDESNRSNPSPESLQQEQELISILIDNFPSALDSIPILKEDSKQIQENLEKDLIGPRQALIPEISSKTNSIINELEEYSTKGPYIYNRLRQRYAEISGNVLPDLLEKTSQDTQKEVQLDSDENEKKEDEKDEENVEEVKREFSESKLSEVQTIRKIPPTFPTTPKKLKTQEAGVERELTEEEIREREYNKQLNEGLLSVFKAEFRKDVPRLSHITLNHPLPRVRAAGALALGRLKKGRLTLEKSIQTDGFVVRTASYMALAEIGHKASLPLFLAGVQSDDAEIRAYSFLGLGKTKDPAGRELILTKGLSSNNPLEVVHSLKGLGYFQIPADLDIIQKHLGSDNKEIQNAALEALTIHNTPESLVVLENALVDYPNLVFAILDAIGESKELAATFFLVRASQLYEDKQVLEKIGSLLVKRKAFGLYGMVSVKEDRLRIAANERAREVGIVRFSDVGLVHTKGTKRFVVRMGTELFEDVYYNMTFENRVIGSKQRYSRGWIFGKKIQLIQIQKPYKKQTAVLRNLQTGKFQNLYDPSD